MRSDRLWTGSFATLLIAQVSFGYSFSSFFLVPKYLATELSAGASEIGLVTAANGAATVVFMFAMGVLVDRYGRRRFLRGGAALMTVAALGFAFVHEVGPLIYLLRVAQGAAFAMAFVAGSTLAVDQAPPRRLGQAIGIFGLTLLSMNAVAPVVTESLAASAGWSWAFTVAGAGSLLCLVLSSFVREERLAPGPEVEVPGLLELARRPRQLRIAAVIAVVGGTFGTMFTFHQPFAIELGMERVQSFFVAYAAAAIASRLGLGHLGDRMGRHRVSILTLALYAAVVMAMIWLRPGSLALFGAAFGLAHGLFYPAFNALAVEGAGEQERGKVMALYQGWFNVGLAGGTFALGFLADAAGYPAVFLAAGLAGFGALLMLILSPEGRGA
jgi:MFS family permease